MFIKRLEEMKTDKFGKEPRQTIKVFLDGKTPNNRLYMGLAIFPPSAENGMHYHDVEEAMYIVSGRGVVIGSEGNKNELLPGTLVFCEAGKTGAHNCMNTSKDIPMMMIFAYPQPKIQTYTK